MVLHYSDTDFLCFPIYQTVWTERSKYARKILKSCTHTQHKQIINYMSCRWVNSSWCATQNVYLLLYYIKMCRNKTPPHFVHSRTHAVKKKGHLKLTESNFYEQLVLILNMRHTNCDNKWTGGKKMAHCFCRHLSSQANNFAPLDLLTCVSFPP